MLDQNKEKCVYTLLRKYEMEPDHAQQVRKLALLIFDKTVNILHTYSDYERDLLEAGSLLHDIGYFISDIGHNKHSYDIIERELEGFCPEEKDIIGNIARYHKGKKPKKKHECYSKLPDEETRTIVKKLSSIARIADGLDRSHISVVDDLDCVYDSFSEILYIVMKLTIPGCGLEIWAADRKKALFEEEFGVQVRFKVK